MYNIYKLIKLFKLIKDIYILIYVNKSEVAQFVQNIPNKKKLNIEIIMFLEFHCGDVFLYCYDLPWLCVKGAY